MGRRRATQPRGEEWAAGLGVVVSGGLVCSAGSGGLSTRPPSARDTRSGDNGQTGQEDKEDKGSGQSGGWPW